MSGKIKKTFIRGLMYLLPILIPLYICALMVKIIDEFFSKILPVKLPFVGVVGFLILVYIFGLIAQSWLGKVLQKKIDRFFKKIPAVRVIYSLSRKLFEEKINGQDFVPCLISEKVFGIGFITGSIKIPPDDKELMVVFLPSTPNVTSGRTVLVPQSHVILLSFNKEEVLKIIISGGSATRNFQNDNIQNES